MSPEELIECAASAMSDATVDAARCPKCGGDNHNPFELCCDCLVAERDELRAAITAVESLLTEWANDTSSERNIRLVTLPLRIATTLAAAPKEAS